jgi:hypothetical protein
MAMRNCRTAVNWRYQEGCKLAAVSAVSGPNVKLLEWMIEHIIIQTLTKLQKKSPSDCQNTGGSINSDAGLFSHLLEEMAQIIQTTDEGQLQCLTIEFALPADR